MPMPITMLVKFIHEREGYNDVIPMQVIATKYFHLQLAGHRFLGAGMLSRRQCEVSEVFKEPRLMSLMIVATPFV